MGTVYRAHDTHLDRDVAIKILPRELSGDPERAARFEREARTLASLQHPNIASIYGYEQFEGTRFLAMELVEGEDLAELIQRGTIAVEDVVRIGQQIVSGLEAAHERSIVHRDLKPANIRIDHEGVVKILDFGLARAYSGDTSGNYDLQSSPTITAAMTQMGVILGTAAYMSPEQARGRRIDKRSDIWSFGIILYEMLTGLQMYRGETVTDILGAIVHGVPDLSLLPPTTPNGLRALIGRCLTPDTQDRLRDIGEARFALTHLDDSLPASSAVSKAARSRRPWLVTSLVLLFALVGMTTLWMQPDPTTPALQASIALPPGNVLRTLGSKGGAMRFSPDGQSIAFVAQASGTRQIWIRSLSEREGRPVQGTERGHRPFWSPDGKSLGFFFEGSLRRVSVSGGAPLTITSAADGRGGTWLADGTIVFAPTPGSGLFAVAAAGGQARPVTSPGKFSHREPRAIGDDGSFLFLENRSGGQWIVCVGNVDGRDRREVVATGGGAEFAMDRLLYLRGTTLVAQSFDLESLSLKGDPNPIAEDVYRDLDYGIGAFSVSRSGGLAYHAGRGAGAQLVFVSRDGSHLASIGKRGPFSQVALSPDEKTIAALIDQSDGASDFWMIDVERGTRQRFTFTSEIQATRRSSPNWTPDGRRLIYTMERDGQVSIFVKRIDGGGEEEVLLSEEDHALWPYDVSADVRWLLYGREGNDTNSAEDLWVLPLSGDGEPRQLFDTPFDEWPGSFSPDGRWLAIDSDESGRREVYVIPFSDQVGRWQISRAGGRYPCWNGDGTELYYQDPEGGLVAVPIDTSAERFSAGEPKQLFQSFMVSGSTADFTPSRGGERFLMVQQSIQDAPISLFLNWKDVLDRR